MSRIEQIIEEIEEYVESCKYQPLSTTKIVVNKEELEELPEGELNFHREIWQNYPYSLFRKNLETVTEIYLYFVISRRNPECIWGNVQEKAEEEILLSKCIESWKSGKKEEGAGLLEAYFRKMAEKLAALHKGQ